MNIIKKNITIFLALLAFMSCSSPSTNENTLVSVRTTLGDIKLKLYDNTPLHRDNFISLLNSHIYDGVSFHRIIKEFMIQAGDPSTSTVLSEEQIDTLSTYTIPAEFKKEYFHKKGALAAARMGNDVNPEMRSSGTQFYIIHGTISSYDDLMLTEEHINSNIKQALFNKMIKDISDSARLSGVPLQDAEVQELASLKMFDNLSATPDFKYSEDKINMYTTIGGVPRLDGTYTVFGEVVEGLDVVDRIAEVPTDKNYKPLNDIRIIKMKIVRK